MKRHHVVIGIVLILLVVLLVGYRSREYARTDETSGRHPPGTQPTAVPSATQHQVSKQRSVWPAQHQQAVALVESIYSVPISFYGHVQDQLGNPIADADVEYSVIHKFWESGSKHKGKSNSDGDFSLTGVKGAALHVAVWKEGYAGISRKSDGAFSFGVPFDAQRDRPVPTKDDPAVFVLRKKAVADPLFVISRDVEIPKDGHPVDISLRTAKPAELGRGDLQIACWTFDQSKDRKGHYDWRVRISIPGGGLLARSDPEFSFTAPETGYEPSVDVTMSKGSIGWRRDHDKQYWVRFHDGTYARMRLRVTTAGSHFASIAAYLNPSGSRNLEYDPNKVIK